MTLEYKIREIEEANRELCYWLKYIFRIENKKIIVVRVEISTDMDVSRPDFILWIEHKEADIKNHLEINPISTPI